MAVTDDQILTAIADLTEEKGYPPTFREMGKRLGLSSTGSVFHRCLGLAEAGLVEPCGTKKARGIRLTPAGAVRLGGRLLPAIATDRRIQQVPVLRSSVSLRQFLETPAHRERIAPVAALAGQDVKIISIADLRVSEAAHRPAGKNSFRFQPKTEGLR